MAREIVRAAMTERRIDRFTECLPPAPLYYLRQKDMRRQGACPFRISDTFLTQTGRLAGVCTGGESRDVSRRIPCSVGTAPASEEPRWRPSNTTPRLPQSSANMVDRDEPP